VLLIFCANEGLLDDLPTDSLKRYEKEFYVFMDEKYPDVVRELREKKAFDKELEAEARKAIAAIFGAVMHIKHVFIVDDDIDVFDDDQMDWALSTRFQADKDLVVLNEMLGMKMDPSLDGKTLGTKAGFDLTMPFTRRRGVETWVPKAHKFGGTARFRTVRQAIESKPMFFTEIMDAVGSRDGRDAALQLDDIRQEGLLVRLEDGEYALADGKDPEITRPPGDPLRPTGLATSNYKRRIS